MRGGDFSAVRDIFDPFSVRRQAGTTSGFVRDPFANRRIPVNRFDSVTGRLIQAYSIPDRAALVTEADRNIEAGHTARTKRRRRNGSQIGRASCRERV